MSGSTGSPIREFLQGKSAGGIVLMAAAAAALIVANSPLAPVYFKGLHVVVAGLPLLDWVNDALMALFFLLVGMEIKREVRGGQLSDWSRQILPGIAAAGGVIVPALIYLGFNSGPQGAPRGWAVPGATDIAFALGVLSLLGARAPASLKLLLTALAIMDDLVAIAVIALVYTHALMLVPLALAGIVYAGLIALNRFGVVRLWPYLLLGIALWFFVFRSGVHATLAGAALAFAIPHEPRAGKESPLYRLEHGLHPWVAFGVVPLFGFFNAGIDFAGLSIGVLVQPVTLGIAAGLFLGKQLGVMGFSWAAIRLGLAAFPPGANWRSFYGVALLCGIGFTMSLFIGVLAFPDEMFRDETKLGVLGGSLLSGLAGALVLATGPRATASRR